jgi:hypothetical protein
MSKQKIYYKAIITETRSSILANQNGVSVTYPVKQWAKPLIEGSKLFVCKTRKGAADQGGCTIFNKRNKKVVRCHIKNPIVGKWRMETFFLSPLSVEHFWKNPEKIENEDGTKIEKFLLDEDVVLCDEVYCLE